MLPPRNTSRIPRITRPLRPPSIRPHVYPQNRPFTQTSNHQLVSPALTRPQLPFLSISSRLTPWPIHLRQHFARLMSTESRDYYRRRISRGLRIGLSFYAILVLFQVIKLGMYQEGIEHQWPTPEEWTWKSRWCLRSARALMHPEEIGKLMTNWPMVAGYLRELIERLEDINGEGKGLEVGENGLDVSGKSEPWRRGYFQALMGAAKAAENLDGWLTDRKQRISAPAEYVVGPSNPRPKPMPAGQRKVPREEDSEAASPSAERFYIKILTTNGFETRQKVDAALAYADWLDYKGLKETAGDMYTWAMDIASAGLSVDAGKVVDRKTGVLKNNSNAPASENIIRVSTALAVHHAKQGDLSNALSIFTSVLKARRSSPPGDTSTIPALPSPAAANNDAISSLFYSIRNMLVPAEYPPPPPSGNDPPLRTPSSTCDEAALMTYIGEIIYASSSKETGLAWTRDAVDTAEATILELGSSGVDSEGNPRQRCAECLKVGLENWRTMVGNLVARAEREEIQAADKAQSSWFGGEKSIKAKVLERKRWEAEKLILEDRARKLGSMIEGETGFEGIMPGSSLFV